MTVTTATRQRLAAALTSQSAAGEILDLLDNAGSVYTFDVTRAPYSALGDGATDDSTSLQAAIDAADAYTAANTLSKAIVYVPDGEYLCEGVTVGASAESNRITISGTGTLKLKDGSAEHAALIVAGNYNRVEGITIDGNAAGAPSGRGEGLRVTGSYNVISGVISQNTKTTGSTGATFFDSGGTGNTFENCFSFSSGYTAFRIAGDTKVRNCYAINHLSHGLGTAGGDLDNVDVDGFYSTGGPDSVSFSGILIDNGVSSKTGYMVRNLSLKNVVIQGGALAMVPLKITRCHTAYLENVQAIHSSSASSLKLAEDIGKIVIKNSYFSHIIDQDESPNDPDGAITDPDAGGLLTAVSDNSGFAQFYSASHGLVTNAYIVITGTTSYNGLHMVTGVSGSYFTTNRKFVTGSEAETGNFYSVAGEISLENVTIGDRVHNTAGALNGIRAHRLFVDRCDFRGYTGFAIGLDNDFSSLSVFDRIQIKDTRIESNDSTGTPPWVIAWNVGNGLQSGQILDRNVTQISDIDIVDVGPFDTRGVAGIDGGFSNVISSNVVDDGNDGTGEDTLLSYTLPANTLYAEGCSLEIEAGFTFANNTNAKQVKMYLGANQIYASGSSAHQSGGMCFRAVVIRDAVNTAKVSVSVTSTGSNTPFAIAYGNAFVQPTVDWSTDLGIAGTGEATSNNDIVMEFLRVKVSTAAP